MLNPANWTASKLCGMCASLSCCFLFVALTLTLGSYGMSNPDPNECWVIKGIDASATTRDGMVAKATALSKPVPEGYPIEMHSVYVAWALWGFWVNFIFIAINVTSMVLMSFNVIPVIAMITSALTATGWVISSILWLVLGTIWRFSAGGSVAAGDKLEKPEGTSSDDWKSALKASSEADGYQLKSGRLLGAFAGLIVALFFVTLSVCCLAGCLVCCCGLSKEDMTKYSQLPQEENNEAEVEAGAQEEQVDADKSAPASDLVTTKD